jgi:hypothetical protein
VQGIELEQQTVVQLQLAAGGRAAAGQLQHGVGAVGVGIDQMVGDAQCAGAAALQRQATERPGRDVDMARAQFAPGDLAVAVAIEPEGEIDVAQGDVPLPGNFLALDLEHQIAVAGLVRQHRQGQQQRKSEQTAAQHHRRVTSADF